MTLVTSALVRKIAPRASKNIVAELPAAANELLPKYGINTPKRIALFFANTLTETGGWRRLDENLNYSAKRLRQVWPKRFPNMAVARQYERNPVKLANNVYGSRLGNKGHRGWGWKYRGRGFIQTTGAYNYNRVKKATGIDVMKNPALLQEVRSGLEAACIFWKQNGCNELADKGQITLCRKRINGGTHGLKSTIAYYKRVLPKVKGLDLTGQMAKDIGKSAGGGVGAGGAGAGGMASQGFDWGAMLAVALFCIVAGGIAGYIISKRKRDKEVKEGLKDAAKAEKEIEGLEDVPDERDIGPLDGSDMGDS